MTLPSDFPRRGSCKLSRKEKPDHNADTVLALVSWGPPLDSDETTSPEPGFASYYLSNEMIYIATLYEKEEND